MRQSLSPTKSPLIGYSPGVTTVRLLPVGYYPDVTTVRLLPVGYHFEATTHWLLSLIQANFASVDSFYGAVVVCNKNLMTILIENRVWTDSSTGIWYILVVVGVGDVDECLCRNLLMVEVLGMFETVFYSLFDPFPGPFY